MSKTASSEPRPTAAGLEQEAWRREISRDCMGTCHGSANLKLRTSSAYPGSPALKDATSTPLTSCLPVSVAWADGVMHSSSALAHLALRHHYHDLGPHCRTPAARA